MVCAELGFCELYCIGIVVHDFKRSSCCYSFTLSEHTCDRASARPELTLTINFDKYKSRLRSVDRLTSSDSLRYHIFWQWDQLVIFAVVVEVYTRQKRVTSAIQFAVVSNIQVVIITSIEVDDGFSFFIRSLLIPEIIFLCAIRIELIQVIRALSIELAGISQSNYTVASCFDSDDLVCR